MSDDGSQRVNEVRRALLNGGTVALALRSAPSPAMDERNLDNRVPLELLLIPESNSSLSRPSDQSLSNGEGDTDLGGELDIGLLRQSAPLLAQQIPPIHASK
jgi:hypothetical protein